MWMKLDKSLVIHKTCPVVHNQPVSYPQNRAFYQHVIHVLCVSFELEAPPCYDSGIIAELEQQIREVGALFG